MFDMIKKQLEDARKFGFDYVIAMAHPDNIASLKSLKSSEWSMLIGVLLPMDTYETPIG